MEALFLHVCNGLSYLDLPAALGVPVGTVRSPLSRLRRRLEECAGPLGKASPPTRPEELEQ